MSHSYRHFASKEIPAIRALEANLQGKDYIIGDVHGNLSLLRKAVKVVGPKDRLFIVGDLADRGKDSLGVYRFLIDHQKNNKQPQIIITRGNHEDVLLTVLNKINSETDFKKLQEKLCLCKSKLKGMKGQDRKTFFLQIQADLKLENMRVRFKELDFIVNGGKWLYSPNVTYTDICQIKNFIKTSIPYVVTVKGSERTEPFHMVHADMPARLTDDYLLGLDTTTTSTEKLNLSDKEKYYATWARKDVSIETPSECRSVIVYCGHTPLQGARMESSHINLDMASFNSGVMCLVNHQDFVVNKMSQRASSANVKIISALESISAALTTKKEFNEHINAVNPADLDKYIIKQINDHFKNKKPSLADKKARYLVFLQRLPLKSTVKENLAMYLIDSHRFHLLAQEGGICRLSRQFSCQTKSFHKAMGYLSSSNAHPSRALFKPSRHKAVFQAAQKKT